MRLYRTALGVKRNPRRFDYTDAAIMPVTDDEMDTHELQQPRWTLAILPREGSPFTRKQAGGWRAELVDIGLLTE